jgi:hypothetical protein
MTLDASNVMIEATTTLSTSQAIHQTLCGRARETTMGTQQELGKLKSLIRWLKNTTDFHLQEPSPIRTAHNQTRSESRALKPKTETEAPSKMKIGSGNHELTQEKIGPCTHELLSRK